MAVLVSEVLPEGIDRIGLLKGVWVCDFHIFRGLAMALREGLIKFQGALKTQANKGEKMEMLFDYLTGAEFKMQIEAIVEGFTALRDGITQERSQMEKLWKEREKQIEVSCQQQTPPTQATAGCLLKFCANTAGAM